MSDVETIGFQEVETAIPDGWMGSELDHFTRYQGVYREIFPKLGCQESDTDTLERAVAVSQPWIRGDYGHDDSLPVELTAEEKVALRELCVSELGMGPARQLPPGDYSKLLLFGASQFGNVRRSEELAGLLASREHNFGRVILLGGERQLYSKEVAGFGRLLDDKRVKAESENDEWLAGIRASFQKHFPDAVDASGVDPSIYRLFGETTQMRISMIKALGAVVLDSNRLEINASTGQMVGIQEFGLVEAGMRATLLHCPPVERKNGPSRHTSESCTNDIVHVLGVKDRERVAFIGAQPHLTRMPMTIKRSFAEAGRPNIDVWAAGPALTEHTPVEICVSEIPKTLHEAWLLKQQLATRA